MSNVWQMPKVNIGDVVLYSNDMHNFSDACVGWVVKEPGHSTLHILTFTPTHGWIDRPSVHHRDDPQIREDNGWDGLGVWDYTDSAKAAMKSQTRASEVRQVAREQVASR